MMLNDWLREPTMLAALVVLPTAAALASAWLTRRAMRARADRKRASANDPHTDGVTGVMSRPGFEAALSSRVATVQGGGVGFCVLAAGLDGFRVVNDTHGPAFGDQLLRATADRLRTLCSPSTPLCRVGGDEFAIALDTPGEAGEVLAQRIVEAFRLPLQANGQEVQIGISVGIATAPAHGAGPALIRNAAAAMRAVKRSGGGTYAVFDPRIEAQHREEFSIAHELRDAVAKNQLELLYQPKIDAHSLQITAVEALMRWRHPTLGIVSPARFIPVAEKHGLIGAIGDWALERALKQAAVWRRAGLRMRVAINVSGYQMRQDDFALSLERGLKTHGLQPGRFTCEITESVAMEDTAVTRRAFARLSKIGVHVSIDDFGTGHSSLAMLRRLPAQELKIDRAFVTDLVQSTEARAIVKAIIEMARALNLKVVAEGVETQEQRDLLVRMGCDELQGYLFAKPMGARAIAIWAADAAKTLSKSFRPSLFAETVQREVKTELMYRPTVIELRRR